MKKTLLIVSLALLGLQVHGAVIATNIVSTAGKVFLLSTNRASIYSVQLSSAYAGTMRLYDCDNMASPYYGTNWATTNTYVTKSSYATNIATSYVGSNGYTNWYTNAGFWTITTTNAGSTNELTPTSIFAWDANTISTYNVDLLHVEGISALVNTNVSVIINYRTGQ